MTQFYAGFSTMQASFVGYIKDGTIYSTDANGQQFCLRQARRVVGSHCRTAG